MTVTNGGGGGTNQFTYEQAKAQAAASRAKDKTAQELIATKKNAAKKAKELGAEMEVEKRSLYYINQDIPGLEQHLSEAKAEYIAYVKAHPNPTHDQQVTIDNLDNAVNAWEATLKPYYAQRTKLTKDIAAKYAEKAKQIDIATHGKVTTTIKPTPKPKPKPKGGNGGGTSGGTTGTGDATATTTGFSSDYKYNAPMISSSYFNLDSMQAKELQANGYFVDAGNYSDARRAWSGQGGRGTIQMDKYFLANYDTSVNAKDTLGQFDPQMYGFKFLYNPTTVGMAWGSMASMSPDFEAAGQDKFNPIMAGLASSTIAFSLLINRIEDMNVLTTTGFKGLGNSLDQLTGETLALTEMLKTLNTDVNVNGPYNSIIDPTDLGELYNRGTMYDLEYLFRTINGPHAVFKSSLNGTTADKGWIRPQVVELHLGNALRYRGRITDLSVNHAVFDARMVPVLSTVNITFARFPDFTLPAAGGSTH